MVFHDFLLNHICIDFGGMFLEPNVHDTSDNTLKMMYFSFPYFGSQSEKLTRNCVL